MVQEIQIRKWVKRGSMMINVDSLDADDPMTPYNQALAQGVKPEDYGLKHPLEEEFEGKSRGELLTLIAGLRASIQSYEQLG